MNSKSFRTLWLSFVVALLLSHGISGGETIPEKVYRIVYTQKSNEWYLEQAKLWKAEVDKNRENVEAWMNLYLANRYADWPEGYGGFSDDKQARLSQIVAEIGKVAPNSYEYNYLKFFNSNEKKENLSFLEKAYALEPDKPDTYYEFIVYYKLLGQDTKASEFLKKLYDSEDEATGLVNYNYNVLMSTEKDAILFTNGDNDTYPCWMLQVAKGIRSDVTVMNISMIRKIEYLKELLDQRNLNIITNELPESKSSDFASALCKLINQKYPKLPIYFAMTVYSGFTEPISDNLFMTGLAYKYSPTRIDNIAMLKNNWEHNLRLDYLTHDWYSEKYAATEMIQKSLNQNYIPLALSLYEHYKISGEGDKAEAVKQLALQIAKPAGKENEVKEILMKK